MWQKWYKEVQRRSDVRSDDNDDDNNDDDDNDDDDNDDVDDVLVMKIYKIRNLVMVMVEYDDDVGWGWVRSINTIRSALRTKWLKLGFSLLLAW